jgi:hypothetical protein
LKVVDDFKEFWQRQSRNYKVIMARNVLGRLLGQAGGVEAGEVVAEVELVRVNTGPSF